MKILHIDASASDAQTSHSRRLSATIVDRFKTSNPGAVVVRRDVVAEPLPHIDMTIREAWTPEGASHPSHAALAMRSKTLVDELKSADVVVIGSPMYNFSVPSTLKTWIDHVAIAGQTFRYTPDGPQGLLAARAVLALSSGGIYAEGFAARNDHLSTYLATVLNFMGIADIETVWAGGMAFGPESEAAAMEAAADSIERIDVGPRE